MGQRHQICARLDDVGAFLRTLTGDLTDPLGFQRRIGQIRPVVTAGHVSFVQIPAVKPIVRLGRNKSAEIKTIAIRDGGCLKRFFAVFQRNGYLNFTYKPLFDLGQRMSILCLLIYIVLQGFRQALVGLFIALNRFNIFLSILFLSCETVNTGN